MNGLIWYEYQKLKLKNCIDDMTQDTRLPTYNY